MKRNDEAAYDRIIHSAAKLFALHGFDGTTTRSIVADAGSSLSVLQACFGSKQNLYQEVMRKTLSTFYSLYAAVFEEIELLENQGILQGDRAWDMIVALTDQVANWAFHGKYHYENLLIHREMLFPSGMLEESAAQMYGLFLSYQKLFEAYTKTNKTAWAMGLAFSTVTGIFDVANYPQFLGNLLDMDLASPENQSVVKASVKNYILTSLRANLQLYRKS